MGMGRLFQQKRPGQFACILRFDQASALDADFEVIADTAAKGASHILDWQFRRGELRQG